MDISIMRREAKARHEAKAQAEKEARALHLAKYWLAALFRDCEHDPAFSSCRFAKHWHDHLYECRRCAMIVAIEPPSICDHHEK